MNVKINFRFYYAHKIDIQERLDRQNKPIIATISHFDGKSEEHIDKFEKKGIPELLRRLTKSLYNKDGVVDIDHHVSEIKKSYGYLKKGCTGTKQLKQEGK